MPKQTDATTEEETEEPVALRDGEELSAEELEDVGGGSGVGKRISFKSSQQSWQSTTG